MLGMHGRKARSPMRRMALLVAAIPTVALAQTPENKEDQWQFSAGLGVASRPKYPGSGDSRLQAVPMLSASYGRYFIGGVPGGGAPFGLGAYLHSDDHLRLGAAVGAGFGKARKESDDSRLRGLGDIDNAARASVFANYTVDWLTIRSNVSTDISGKDQGVLATLDLEGKLRLTDRFALSAGPGLTWANGDYTQTFFGITADQSARSGLPTYTAKSGLNLLRFSVGAEYGLTKQWGLAARVTAGHLRGDAANSPITADKSQNSYALFATYRF